MRALIRLTVMALAGVSFSGCAFCDLFSYSFGTIPADGAVEGQPGSKVGCGYSIANNDPTHWLITTNLGASLFQNGTPDASLFDFTILAPSSSISVIFDAVSGTGLYGLTWDSTAPTGFVNSGTFDL